MGKKDKIIVCTLGVLLAAAVFVMFNFRARYENKIRVLDKKIQVVLDAKARLQDALDRSIKESEDARLYVEHEKERSEALDKQLKGAFLEASRARADMKGLEAETEVLKNRLTQLEQEKVSLKAQVSSFMKIQENLERKIKRLLTRTKVELGHIVVTSSLNGKILKANRPYNFVIIDLGRNDGVKTGMTFTAYRENEDIGDILIEKVYDELSVGKAIFNWVGAELNIGDRVKGKE
jgi:cell shape-determining protein MreC